MTPKVADRLKTKKAQSRRLGKESRFSQTRDAQRLRKSKLARARKVSDVVLVGTIELIDRPIKPQKLSELPEDKRKKLLPVDATREFSDSGLEITGTMDGYL